VDPQRDTLVLKGIASPTRIQILNLLQERSRNVNEIAQALSLPQSTVALNISVLQEAGLIATETVNARRGSQKVCSKLFDEVVVRFESAEKRTDDVIEVEMPVGLFSEFEAAPPCGLAGPERIIGYLDDPSYFLDPQRVKAGLLWFEKGFVEYKFPNNLLNTPRQPRRIEVSMELSSEVPSTNEQWRSDITVWINGVEIGHWTAPGDFGGQRGKYTPRWRPLNSSQYGLLKAWSVSDEGAFVDGVRIGDVRLGDLDLMGHKSIRVRVGVKDDAENLGGVNIFGKGFGNHDQDIVLRMYL
jgi:predicted transcriptional regulator